MSKLRTVIRHEYLTIVKKLSFWIVMLAIPTLIIAIGTLSYFGSKASEDRIAELTRELKNVAIIDQSGLIRQEIIQGAGLTINDSAELESLRSQVQYGQKEALLVYPADLAQSRSYQVYVSSNDISKSGSVTGLADSLLQASLFAPLGSPDVIALAQNGAESRITAYDEGRETAGVNEFVVPGVFLLLFFIIFMFSVSYMLSSVSEEKENRSMEMVLTYVNATTLIVGKLLAVTLVTLTQIAFFGTLIAIGLIVALSTGLASLPAGIDLTRLVYDPQAILFGLGYLLAGFMMFAGFMTTVAAAAPSSREANSFSGIFYFGSFAPLYLFSLIITAPDNALVRFLSFFPLTSPVVALLRNTFGSIGLLEASLMLFTMSFFAVAAIAIAIRTFRVGALEFQNSLTLSSLLRK